MSELDTQPPIPGGKGNVAEPSQSSATAQGVEYVESELVVAAQRGDLEKIKDLVSKTPSLAQEASADGITVLHWASINNRLTICKYLLDQGAIVDAKGGELLATPLHWACRNGLVYIVDLLLQHGADPLKCDSQGFNALHLAVHSSNVLLVIYLLHLEIPIDTCDPAGRTALHWAAYQGDALSVDALLNWGADARLADTLGFTALHWAIVKGNKSCMKRLIEEGSDIFALSNDGKSPRVMAQEMNTYKTWVSALIEAGRLESGVLRTKWLTSRQTDLILFFFPFFLIFIVFYIFSAISLPIAIPVNIVILAVSMQIIARFILPNGYLGHQALMRSPFLSGIFSGSAFWTLVVYFIEVLPATFWSLPLTNVLFSIFFAVTVYCFFTAMLIDPGYVPKLSGVSEQKAVIQDLITKGQYDATHFCIATYVRKPLRSKYDRESKRVVARFDHYCPWINNVVGVRNHRLFVLYVLTLIVGIILYLILFSRFLEGLNFDDENQCKELPLFICTAFYGTPFASSVSLWITFQLIWVIFLGFVQLVQIAKAMTTNEAINLHRHGFFGSENFSSVPLDHESVANRQAELNKSSKTHQRKCWTGIFRVLGIDQFLATAQDAISSKRSFNPFSHGVMRNCSDFWRSPSQEYNLLEIPSAGQGYLNGQLVDYDKLWEVPATRHGDYELMSSMA